MISVPRARRWLGSRTLKLGSRNTPRINLTKTPKRPRDPNQLAKFVIDMASGEVEDRPESMTAITCE